MKPVRNSIKALIIRDGKLLCTKNEDAFGIFYLLPGGGQEPGETMHEALKRECLEEIASEIEIGELKFVREYIGKNHAFKEWDSEIHQVEYMFICKLTREGTPVNGSIPDSTQIGVEWLELEKLKDCRLYPHALISLVHEDGSMNEKIYLGDTD